MAGDDNNKNKGGSGGITYDSPYYLYPSDYPKQLHENRTPHESDAFNAFQRRNGPPGLNKERSRAKSPRKKGEKKKCKAACVKTETGPIPRLTYEDYQLFLKHFSGTGNSEGTKPVANIAHKEDEEGEWIFDSGCTEYITYLSNILVNKKSTHFEAPVVIPNGDSIPVKGKGDYILPEGTKVNKVLYVPHFKFNLLYVSRLSRDLQCCISFFPDFCVMQGLQRRNLIGAGRCEGGLYRMKMVQGRRAMTTTIETWHKRLGHASKGKLGQPNNDEFETNESNEGAEAQAKTRPTQTRTQPSRFKDFIIQVPPSVKHPSSTSNQVTSTVRYPISNFVSYDKFSNNHKAFLAAITNTDEPKCFKQAAQDARWREPMQKEVKALEKNGT
ncbi:hypothetical protein Tco_0127475 [Tanacetum coccineum]